MQSRYTDSGHGKANGTFHLVHDDVVVLVDDGTGETEQYEELSTVARTMCSRYPNGFGLLVIIPKHARPPTDEARNSISATMDHCGSQLKCVCWLVEGSGFQAAMVRAVLNGLRLIVRRKYQASVEVELPTALQGLYEALQRPKAIAVGESLETARYVRSERLRR